MYMRITDLLPYFIHTLNGCTIGKLIASIVLPCLSHYPTTLPAKQGPWARLTFFPVGEKVNSAAGLNSQACFSQHSYKSSDSAPMCNDIIESSFYKAFVK